jgi:hypothetical protein
MKMSSEHMFGEEFDARIQLIENLNPFIRRRKPGAQSLVL